MALNNSSYRADSQCIGQDVSLGQASGVRRTPTSSLANHDVDYNAQHILDQAVWNNAAMFWEPEWHRDDDNARHFTPTSRSPSVSSRNDDSAASSRSHLPKDAIPNRDMSFGLLDDSSHLRCFDHDCGGRIFSSAENYRRHIREKEASSRWLCTICRTSFTRRSNLRKHLTRGKCRMAYSNVPSLRTSHVPM